MIFFADFLFEYYDFLCYEESASLGHTSYRTSYIFYTEPRLARKRERETKRESKRKRVTERKREAIVDKEWERNAYYEMRIETYKYLFIDKWI